MIKSVTVSPLTSSGNVKTDHQLSLVMEDYDRTGIVLYDLKGLGPEAEVHSKYVCDDYEEFTNAANKPKELTFTLWLLGTDTTDVPQLRQSLNGTFPIGKKVGITITSDYTASGTMDTRAFYIEGIVQSINPAIFQQIIETVEIVVKCPDPSFSGLSKTVPLTETKNYLYFTKHYPATGEVLDQFDQDAFWKTDESDLIISEEVSNDAQVLTMECESTFPTPYSIDARAATNFGNTDVLKFMALNDDGQSIFSITIDNKKIDDWLGVDYIIHQQQDIRISCYPKRFGVFLKVGDGSRMGTRNSNGWLYGDVNHDEKITTDDARYIEKIALDLVDPTEMELDAADVNGDGEITVSDARIALAYAINKELPGWLNITGVCDITGEWPKLTNGLNSFIFTGMTSSGAPKASVIDSASISYTTRYAGI